MLIEGYKQEIKKIGFDFDGTFTYCNQELKRTLESLRIPWSIINLLFINSRPNKRLIKALKKIQRDYKIVIISSRPTFLRKKIENFLVTQGLQEIEIICTGWLRRKNRKLKALKETGINVYIDNEKDIREFLKENLISTFSPLAFCKLVS